MTKYLLFLLLTTTLNSSFSQGAIRLSAEQNETCKLADNVVLESVTAKIVPIGGEPIVYFTFSAGNRFCYLRPGYYQLEIQGAEGNKITVCNILIRDSEYTFIDVLLESCETLSRRDIRKRKMYANYSKKNCK